MRAAADGHRRISTWFPAGDNARGGRRATLRARPVMGAVGAYALLGLGCAAHAESAGPKADANTLDNVVVTARQVEERLQDVPAAVTAITSRQLEVIKPRTIQDLSGLAPNVSIGSVGAGAGVSAIYIRGLGYQDVEKGQNPSVGLLIDDVVIGTNTAQLIDAFDVQQVEILRGPQGIFFGKNTTAGAIVVHRSKPTHKWGLNTSVAFGDYGQNIQKFVANAPIGETAGLKIGASHNARDGFIHNIYTGDKHYGNNELNTVNVQFDWDVTPQLNLLLSVDSTNQTGEGSPQSLGDPLTAKVLGPLFAPAGIQFNSNGSPYIPGVTRPLGPRETANDFPDRNRLNQQRYSASLKWDTPIGQFVSITAYIEQHDSAEQDFDGSCGTSQLQGPCPVLANPLLGFGFLHTVRPQDYTQFTQEVRLVHDFGEKGLLTGVYYYHHKISAVQLTRTAAPGVPVTAPLTRQDSGETNKAVSVFANLDYNLTDRLRLSAGARYIHESKQFHNGFELLYIPGVGPATLPLVPQFQRSNSWNQMISRFSIDYKLTKNNLVYASRSEGFRSGGFSPRSTLSESLPGQTNFAPGADYSGYSPETNVAYEIGSKNTFFNGQLTVNAAAFKTKVTNHQQSLVVLTPGFGPGTNTYIASVPKVSIKGLEGEVLVRPQAVPGLIVSLSGGYQKARITNGKIPGVIAPVNADGAAGAPGSVYDLTGTDLERVPKFTYAMRADYSFEVMGGTANLNAGYKWTDKFVFTTFAGQPDIQPSYGLVDASASYAWDRYKLTVSGKNLANKLYRTNSLPVVFFQGWAEPRTFLAELTAKF